MQKKIMAGLVIAVLGITTANAQFLKIGPKAGANLVKITGKSFKDEFQLGYYVGGFAELRLAKNFYLQPEVLFSQTDFNQSNDFRDIYQNVLNVDSAKKIRLRQLNIPITVNYKIANVLALSVGPQFSIMMDKNNTLLKNAGNAFSEGEFAMVGGANIMLGKFRINGRYVIGLSDFNDIDNQEQWKSQSLQLGVGFVF